MTNITPLPAQQPAASANAIVAANIRAEIGLAGIKQVVLASALGENEMWLSRRLTSQTEFTTSEVQAIANYFGVTPGDLFIERQRPSRPVIGLKHNSLGSITDIFTREPLELAEVS